MPFANRTGSGSVVLQSRVFYPAQSAGQNAPILAQAGGWPVVVFLHGRGSIGQIYADIWTPLAANGYVAVMVDTALTDGTLLMRDGTALYPTLVAENNDTNSFFNGALDMARAAIQGYSMGGGSAVRVLIANPGYKCGFFHAPSLSSSYYSQLGSVRVPLGFTQGLGDTVVSTSSVKSLHDAAGAYTNFKFHYQFNTGGDHNNITASYLGRPQDLAVIARVKKVFLGFYARVLGGDSRALESVLGTEARSEPYLAPKLPATQQSSPFCAFEQPQAWLTGNGQLNSNLRLTLLSEPGTVAYLVAPAVGNTPTPYGVLGLDLGTLDLLASTAVGISKFAPVDVTIPALPGLIGVQFWFQDLGYAIGAAPKLTTVDSIQIVP